MSSSPSSHQHSSHSKQGVWQKILHLDRFLDFHAPLLVILLALFILRLPNYFEPYWYGDEGIYLTIGKALNQGRELYAEIIDHKTPMIYLFARLSEQLHFRLFLTAWMLLTTTLFYSFTYTLFKNRLSTTVATILFGIFTTVPWFEGNIPNGELFVMGFVVLGAVLLQRTTLFSRFIDTKTKLEMTRFNTTLLFTSGVAFGLGILTKVPAIFDLIAFGSIGLLILTNELSFSPKKAGVFIKMGIAVINSLVIFVAGTVATVLASILFFMLRGTQQAYLDYGLLYNFHYAGSWSLSFDNPLLQAAFTFQGKFVLMLLLILAAIVLRKALKPVTQLAVIWTATSLFASLLSNRPYPHYFLQIIPPLALLLGSFLQELIVVLQEKRVRPTVLATGSLCVGLTTLFISILMVMNVGLYPTAPYYKNWISLVNGNTSSEDYRNQFNYLMADNYAAAPILRTAKDHTVFIWGTNPVLYALSDTIPAGRFTVSFHIADFNAYEETMASIEQQKPEFVVIMNQERTSFPALNKYVQSNYIENSSFEHFAIWRRRSE